MNKRNDEEVFSIPLWVLKLMGKGAFFTLLMLMAVAEHIASMVLLSFGMLFYSIITTIHKQTVSKDW